MIDLDKLKAYYASLGYNNILRFFQDGTCLLYNNHNNGLLNGIVLANTAALWEVMQEQLAVDEIKLRQKLWKETLQLMEERKSDLYWDLR